VKARLGKGLIVRHRSLLILTTAVAAGSLTLSACGSRGDDGGGGSSGDTKTVTIGLDAPLTGDLSALGQGIKNSADLAVKTASRSSWTRRTTPHSPPPVSRTPPSSPPTRTSSVPSAR
jgi:branched-chain amino acid transport system substrate-binding protein